jgi:hypothetical protein
MEYVLVKRVLLYQYARLLLFQGVDGSFSGFPVHVAFWLVMF